MRRPDWDYGTEGSRKPLSEYHQILLDGLRLTAHKPTSLSKEADVKQGLEELPGSIPAIYTSIDLEDPENLKTINLAFVIQSAPDVCKKNPKDGWICRKELVRIIRNIPKSV